jgi:hypothetical protein
MNYDGSLVLKQKLAKSSRDGSGLTQVARQIRFLGYLIISSRLCQKLEAFSSGSQLCSRQ